MLIVIVCLFGNVLNSQSGIYREFQAALLSLQWILLVCLALWCGTFLFLTFSRRDLLLIGLLLIAIVTSFIAVSPATDAITLLAGVTLGKGMYFALSANGKWKIENGENSSEIVNFFIGLVILPAFASWWHLKMVGNYYHGPRWMGLWDNPNTYGMLMGAGVLLATGLLVASLKSTVQSPQSLVKEERKMENAEIEREDGEKTEGSRLRRGYGGQGMKNEEIKNQKAEIGIRLCTSATARRGRKAEMALLLIAAGMMAVGLFFSYSRGAWLGTTVGLLYLARAYGKFKWRYVLPEILVVAAIVCFFWNATPDSSPWYLKRADLSRPSAQHRVAAWKAGFEIMRDHPFGVGWNNTVKTYNTYYSPPEDGAGAINTNDYLMLGTQLGIPALLCFVAYVALCFRSPKTTVNAKLRMKNEEVFLKSETDKQRLAIPTPVTYYLSPEASLRVACRSAALSLLVAFWFDGGIFKLPTAVVFCILLELGAYDRRIKTSPVLSPAK